MNVSEIDDGIATIALAARRTRWDAVNVESSTWRSLTRHAADGAGVPCAPRLMPAVSRTIEAPPWDGLAMKAYLVVTATLFGLLTLAHLWRVLAESSRLATDPWYLLITALSAALCVWACRLLAARTPANGR